MATTYDRPTVEDNDSMRFKWDYSGADDMCFSDPNCESYKKARAFLGDTVEDWGCGTGWAKRYFTNYHGIDGSPSKFVTPEETVDLVNYTSDVDNILIRQTLECNEGWKKILDNIKASFRKKLCIIIYTPFVKKTRVGFVNVVKFSDGTASQNLTISEIYFNKEDIIKQFPPAQYTLSEEEVITEQGYGRDWILYVEKTS